jgi:hypothetical protein
VKNASIRPPLEVPALPMVPCPRGNQSIDVDVVCIAQRRLSFSVTLPLSLASDTVPERSAAEPLVATVANPLTCAAVIVSGSLPAAA